VGLVTYAFEWWPWSQHRGGFLELTQCGGLGSDPTQSAGLGLVLGRALLLGWRVVGVVGLVTYVFEWWPL